MFGLATVFLLFIGVLAGYLAPAPLRATAGGGQQEEAAEQGVSAECLQEFLGDIQGCLQLPATEQPSCVLNSVQTLLACLSGTEDEDGDGFTVSEGDCNDSNPTVFPGAAEVCDGMDNDCDGEVDEENVCAEQGQWTALAPLAMGPRQEVGVAAVQGKVYVIGGFNALGATVSTVEVYDSVNDSWESAASLPQALHHVAAASVEEKVYVIGGLASGFTAVGSTFEYDPTTNTWQKKAPMPLGTERGALAVAVIDDKIYAAGGLRAGRAVADFAVYHPSQDTWEVLPSMPTARDHLAAGTSGGKFYAVGGRAAQITAHFPVLEEYDPQTNTWRSLAPMPTSRGGLAAAVLGERLIAMGGEGNLDRPSGVFAETEEYDPQTNTWRSLTPMLTPRHGMGAAVIGDKTFVPGGATMQGFGASDANESFFFTE